jgi:carbamoyl-phosphate synthase large subunit
VPKRTDIGHVLVIGSGPIVIGQACEFDYSGTQACRVLRAEGLRVSLVNSNPATIMTDPEFADATYIEPITPEYLEQVIARERPDALLPTLGGQTALNAAVALHEQGVLDKYGVELIGANIDAIRRGEDRQLFKEIVALAGEHAGFDSGGLALVPRSRVCRTMAAVYETAAELGLPLVIRPSFTMGGLGSGMAHTAADLDRLAGGGLAASPVHEVLVEESVLGWKEYELELMRDRHDNVVVVCSIENLDPMGVHTGDSVTVAPAMTLTDVEYQRMRDLGIAVLREVGVDTGGCNIQFAINPADGRLVVIEMNPRVSRSSALASKATGFPIAKIAAKLAIGYTLDEIANDITGETPAAFEPSLDYVVVKIPRFAFEKFPGADQELTTTMKSVGEAMSLGRNFTEALGKAMRSMETKAAGFWSVPDGPEDLDATLAALKIPHDGRLYTIERALRLGASVAEVHAASGVDPWFLDQIASLVDLRAEVVAAPVVDEALLRRVKRAGLSDRQVAALRPELAGEAGVRTLRHRLGLRPVYKTVDTCAAEFAALTPYHYSSYEAPSGYVGQALTVAETEVEPSVRAKVLILGSGPNRIGQGIEFDYSCVHAVQALRGEYETVMINCNPETVSTDYDTADRLYFEPLTFEDVLEVWHAEDRSGRDAGGPGVVGVIVQLGGQTPLGLAQRLKDAGVPIVGTSPESINMAEDRGAFGALLGERALPAPAYGTATSFHEAKVIADGIGYPVLVRPSYVLGGRGMEIVYDDETLRDYIGRATDISPSHPVLVDRFLDDAIEIDVDALCDATGEVYLGGVMEHIEEAGIHSGDSSCALPPITLGATHLAEVRRYTEEIARGIGVRGLLNVQYALQGDALYVLEANPRASRTVPFVSKATAVPLAKAASRIMLGATIAELRTEGMLAPTGDGGTLPVSAPVAVKEAVLPFKRFRTRAGKGVDNLLGPEMKSTGEVMGIDATFGHAFAKSQAAAYGSLPTSGRILVTVANRDKRGMIFPIKRLADLGFEIVATEGTGAVLRRYGVACEIVTKHYESAGDGRDAVGLIESGQVTLVITTPQGSGGRKDGYEIRSAAVAADIPCITTVPGASAAVMGIEALIRGEMTVRPLQEFHAALWRAVRGADGAV